MPELLDTRRDATGAPLRPVVPSARQESSTAGDDMGRIVTDRAEVQRRGRSLVSGLRDLNPFTVPGRRLPLAVFCLLEIVHTFQSSAVGIALPNIQATFGLSVTALAVVGSITGGIGLVLGLPIGYLVDRVKRVWLLRITAVVQNGGIVLQTAAAHFGGFLAGTATAESAGTLQKPLFLPLLSDYHPPRARGRVFTIYQAATLVAMLVASTATAALVQHYGWRAALLAITVVALIPTVATFFVREPVRGGMDRLEAGASEADPAPRKAPLTFSESLRAAWAVRTLRWQAIGQFVISLATAPLLLFSQLILANRFLLDPIQRGELTTLMLLVTLPFFLMGGGLADRLQAHRPSTLVSLEVASLLLAAVAFVVIGYAPAVWLFAVGMILLYLASSVANALSQTIMSLVTPARIRGVGMNIGTPFALVGLFMQPAIVAFVSHGSLQHGVVILTPVMLIGTLIFGTSASTMVRDIRAARAATLAGEEARRAHEAGDDLAVICRDVDVAYGGVPVVTHVDLQVREGELLALLGTNGAGKSSLLRAIAGQVEADNGAIVVFGRDVTHLPVHETTALGVVFMPGGAAVFPDMSVRDNLRTAALARRRTDADDEPATTDDAWSEVLELFPILRERLDTPAGVLSGGEQQMVGLGQALLMRPRLLMIDELSLGLAPAVIEQLLAVLRRIHAGGTTVLLVEQSLNVAMTIADRAVFMEKGEVVFDGATTELLARPDLVRAIFMGGAAGTVTTRTRSAQPAESDNLLIAEGLSLAFGGVQALSEVSLLAAPGEVLGIIGPNGAGKTTLFDLLSGYERPDTGRVLLGTDDVTAFGPDARARRGLARSFQNARLFPALSVRETVAVAYERRASRNALAAALWLPPLRRKERQLSERVDGLLELLGLTRYADTLVRELSTGTRRAVEVACQMAAEPKVLLLDEPSSGLAQAEVEVLGPTLTRIGRETGCAMLVIEHDLPLIEALADRLIAMELGRVIATGPPREVLSDSRVLSSYLSASTDIIERSGSRVGAVLAAVSDTASPSSGSARRRPQEGTS